MSVELRSTNPNGKLTFLNNPRPPEVHSWRPACIVEALGEGNPYRCPRDSSLFRWSSKGPAKHDAVVAHINQNLSSRLFPGAVHGGISYLSVYRLLRGLGSDN